MYIRRKKNATGSISIQVIDKSSGKYKVKRTIGSSKGPEQLKVLIGQAEQCIAGIKRQKSLDFTLGDDRYFYNRVYESIDKVQLLGPELVLGKLYEQIGFHKVEDELFRHLVITRLVYPVSKLKTIDYLLKYKGVAY